MIKKIKKSDGDDLAKRTQEILQDRSKWFDLTGGDLTRGIELLEDAGYKAHYPGAIVAFAACMSALGKWRRLSHELVGWALAARTHAHSKNWCEPNHNRPASHARRSQLLLQLKEAIRESFDSDSDYVIVALPKEITLEVQMALNKLSYGEVDSILEPAKRKNYRGGYTIPRFRKRIVLACHYCFGSGLSMAMARKRIADIVGEQFETLRNWERSLERLVDTHPEYGIYSREELIQYQREELIQYQVAGAVASGGAAAFDDAKRRLKLDLYERSFSWWRYYAVHPLEWNDEYLAKLGRDYQHALKEQKRLAQRGKR